MIGFYNYTVILTYIGFACGMFGVYSAANGKTEGALLSLLLAGLCDMFDGKIAKTKKDRTQQECRFGIQIDSLSDMLCFGVLPPMIAYSAGLRHPVHMMIYFCYSLTALIRLAYFNVTEEERQDKTNERRKVYEGLPVTSSALIIPLLFAIPNDWTWFSIAAAIVYGVTAVAFVTRFTLKKPQMRAMLLFIVAGALELLLLILQKCLH